MKNADFLVSSLWPFWWCDHNSPFCLSLTEPLSFIHFSPEYFCFLHLSTICSVPNKKDYMARTSLIKGGYLLTVGPSRIPLGIGWAWNSWATSTDNLCAWCFCLISVRNFIFRGTVVSLDGNLVTPIFCLSKIFLFSGFAVNLYLQTRMNDFSCLRLSLRQITQTRYYSAQENWHLAEGKHDHTAQGQHSVEV